jgi:hypothetical protein
MPAAALISLIVGVLATIMAGFTLISTKENKVSDHRQAWIDAMRDDIAEALATAFAAERETDKKEKVKFLKSFDECHARIEMREHTSLKKWPKVRAALASVRGYINGEAGPYMSLKAYKEVILEQSRSQLKDNWEIVKKGEPFFQVFKWTFVGWLAVLGLTLLVMNGINLRSERIRSRPSAGASVQMQATPGVAVGRGSLSTSEKPAPSQVGGTWWNSAATVRR